MLDLNKSLAEDEEELDPLEDVVVAIQVGGAKHFGLHPDENEEEQIGQGKHFGLSISLYVSLSLSLSLSLLKLEC